LTALAALGLLAGSAGQAPDVKKDDKKKAAADQAALEACLKKARGNGKYAMLLRQFKVEDDKESTGDFREMGLQRKRRYEGYGDLPEGYWVYAYPYWYIWRDLTATPSPKRAWGPEQVTGPPDTTAPGDFGTAWASLTPDGQDEWLVVEYAEPVVPKLLRVHETWNPGAVEKVSAFRLDGEEVEVWKGTDPTSADSDKGVSEIPLKADFKTSRLRLHLDSRRVRGWNEIDAVGLVDESGKTHWATAAEASSTSADGKDQAVLQALVASELRARRLEQELAQLKAAVLELKKGKKKDE
jgi:hypothetical protein